MFLRLVPRVAIQVPESFPTDPPAQCSPTPARCPPLRGLSLSGVGVGEPGQGWGGAGGARRSRDDQEASQPANPSPLPWG